MLEFRRERVTCRSDQAISQVLQRCYENPVASSCACATFLTENHYAIKKQRHQLCKIMSAENNSPMAQPGRVSWNELATTNVAAAKKFYTGLFGWKTEPFGGDYTLFKQGKTMVGGMMKCPKKSAPAHWLAYVTVKDVDASAAKAAKLGGKVVAPPFDVPEVGRIAVVLDPQGAAIGLFKPEGC
jgi:uncharacterized protein